MLHRHLNHERLTTAAIDNVIDCGKWSDWRDLRLSALGDPGVLAKIERVCAARVSDPYAQRHHFWMNYAKAHKTTA